MQVTGPSSAPKIGIIPAQPSISISDQVDVFSVLRPAGQTALAAQRADDAALGVRFASTAYSTPGEADPDIPGLGEDPLGLMTSPKKFGFSPNPRRVNSEIEVFDRAQAAKKRKLGAFLECIQRAGRAEEQDDTFSEESKCVERAVEKLIASDQSAQEGEGWDQFVQPLVQSMKMKKYRRDVDLQKAACKMVAFLSNLGTPYGDMQDILQEAGCITLLHRVTARKRNREDSDLQKLACVALVGLTTNHNSNQELAVDANWIEAVLQMMKAHQSNLEVQQNALDVLSNLATVKDSRVFRELRAGILSTVSSVMTEHTNDWQLLEKGFKVLSTIFEPHCSEENSPRLELVDDERSACVKTILCGMKNHTATRQIQEQGCKALACLSTLARSASVDREEQLLQRDCTQAVVTAMRTFKDRHSSHWGLQLEACNALCKLPATDSNPQIIDALGFTLQMFKSRKSPEVVKRALKALNHVTKDCAKNQTSAGTSRCIEAVVGAMTLTVLSNDSEVQLDGCEALRSIIAGHAGNQRIESDRCLQALVAAMKTHTGLVNIQKAAIGALIGITSAHEINQEIAGKNGCVEALLQAMKMNGRDASLQFDACRALTELAAHSATNREKARESGCLEILINTMQCDPASPTISTQACNLLWTISHDCIQYLTQAGAARFVKLVVAAMLRFQDPSHDNLHFFLQRTACKVLSHLSTFEPNRETAVSEGCLNAITSYMSQFKLEGLGFSDLQRDVQVAGLNLGCAALAATACGNAKSQTWAVQAECIRCIVIVLDTMSLRWTPSAAESFEMDTVTLISACKVLASVDFKMDPDRERYGKRCIEVLVWALGIATARPSMPKRAELVLQGWTAVGNILGHSGNEGLEGDGRGKLFNTLAGTMRGFRDNAQVQKQAVHTLRISTLKHDESRDEAGKAGCVESVIEAMKQNEADPGLQDRGCLTLVSLLSNHARNQEIAERHGCLACVVHAMNINPKDFEIQLSACKVLTCITSFGNRGRVAVQSGVYQAVKGAMVEFREDAKLQKEALITLCSITSGNVGDSLRANKQEKAGKARCIEEIRASMANPNFKRRNDLQKLALQALASITSDHKQNQRRAETLRCAEAVADSMEQCPKDEELQEHACSALASLTSLLPGVSSLKSKMLTVIGSAMNSHRQSAGVLKDACRALCSKSAFCAARVASGREDSSSGINQCFLGIRHALASADELEVQRMATCALANLTADGSEIRTRALAGEAGCISALGNTLARGPLDPEVCKKACEALANLTNQNARNQDRANEAGCMAVVVKAMTQSEAMTNGGLQKLACRALANMTSGHGVNRDEVRGAGCIEAVVRVMRQHITDSQVQEQACEVLFAVASNHAPNRELALELGCLDDVKSAVRKHETIRVTADKALQLLSESSDVSAAQAGQAKTFEHSNFRAEYRSAVAESSDFELLTTMKQFLLNYCQMKQIECRDGQILMFIERIRTVARMEAAENWEEEMRDVAAFALRIWTSVATITFDGRGEQEFCGIINEAIRDDFREVMAPLAKIVRTINLNLLMDRNDSLAALPWPENSETFRGAILPQEHIEFYERMLTNSLKYRIPGFLATSFSKKIANTFAKRSAKGQAQREKHYQVLYVISLNKDSDKRCRHVSYVSRPGNALIEEEFLYVPYSTFEVVSLKLSRSKRIPHEIHLRSAIDNADELEDLPLAPWY